MKNELYKMTEKRLYDYPFLEQRIKMIMKRIDDLDYNRLSAKSYVDTNITNPPKDFVAADAINIIDFKEKLQKEIYDKEKLAFEIEKALECLSALEYKIIIMRYFKLKKMLEISDTLGYSREYGSRVRKKAVIKIGMVLFGVSEEEMQK